MLTLANRPLSDLGQFASNRAGPRTAHEQGIVHRDLKPANVKVKPAMALAWRADGRELFYIDRSGAFMAASVSPGPSGSPRAAVPTRLFQIDPRLLRSFDVTAHGQRFLVNIANPDAVFRTDEVVVDWTRRLRR